MFDQLPDTLTCRTCQKGVRSCDNFGMSVVRCFEAIWRNGSPDPNILVLIVIITFSCLPMKRIIGACLDWTAI